MDKKQTDSFSCVKSINMMLTKQNQFRRKQHNDKWI